MGRKKKENKPKIIFKFEPFTEEQLDKAIKKLAHLWATDMGWVPKELVEKKRNKDNQLSNDKANLTL